MRRSDPGRTDGPLLPRFRLRDSPGTLAPIDRTLVEPDLLTPAERAWLDGYHARVREAISPKVDREAAAWLAEATRPLASR